MRDALRRQILEMITTLVDAVDYAATKGDSGRAMLSDCYTSVRAINDALSGALSDARFSVYACLIKRLLYELSVVCHPQMKVGQKERIPVEARKTRLENDHVAAVRQLFDELAEKLRNETEVRIKIVFFPYKAAMWDALESVYAAAMADPHCDVSVVPIPYFDIIRSGADNRQPELRRCDETDLFPDGLPIIRCDDYNLAVEVPDIAYIHNVYDDRNRVTSVDPRFYTPEIRRYAGRLVYVPYYINGSPGVDVTGTISEAFLSAAVSAADIIIAPNEQSKKTYLSVAPGKTVLALGSPKIDRVLALSAAPPRMPEEWQRALQNRRVFLLNTSITELLQYSGDSDRFLLTLRRIFSAFRGREGEALLFRPHPLTEATIQSMRKEMFPAYRALIEEFLAAGLGVIDDTPDAARAIALSDVYIGESGTSLAYMFSVTGKPLFIPDYAKGGEAGISDADAVFRDSFQNFFDTNIPFRESTLPLSTFLRLLPNGARSEAQAVAALSLLSVADEAGQAIHTAVMQLMGGDIPLKKE